MSVQVKPEVDPGVRANRTKEEHRSRDPCAAQA